jgi:tetratricopeptide (TPR) repeat protein
MSDTLAKKLHKEGIDLFRKGDLEAALQKLNEALPEADQNSKQAAEICNDIGVVHTQLEDYEAAHKALDEAMEKFTASEDEKGQAQTLGNRGAVYQAQGLLEEAIETYKESATMLEAVGENEMAMYVWQSVSKLRMKQGQYIAAIGAYEEGVDNMPQGSFKRKVLQQILKAPGALLGGPGASNNDDELDEDEQD